MSKTEAVDRIRKISPLIKRMASEYTEPLNAVIKRIVKKYRKNDRKQISMNQTEPDIQSASSKPKPLPKKIATQISKVKNATPSKHHQNLAATFPHRVGTRTKRRPRISTKQASKTARIIPMNGWSHLAPI